MKFAHFADVHIGSWRDERLADVSTKAFIKAIDICIAQSVEFILISGDFFNTSLPSIDRMKDTVTKLKELADKGIPVYIIAGSHDFSPTGKTMLDVLENAGLFINVMRGEVIDNKLKLRFTIDKKTGAKITGIIGKKGMLERQYYEHLISEHLQAEPGFKIFMFHTAIAEFKPAGLEKMDATPLSAFPKNFNYYAGGHVHEPYIKEMPGFGIIANTGPLFPNNFRELEKLGSGNFYIVEGNERHLAVYPQQVTVHNVHTIAVDCAHKSPEEVESEILKHADKEFNNTIVTIRLSGQLMRGRPSDINFRSIFEKFYEKSAHFVMKNTSALSSKEFEEIKITSESIEAVEDAIIREHVGKLAPEGMSPDQEFQLIRQLMHVLNTEKQEGETASTYEQRLKDESGNVLKMWL
jgi:DNA repair protein SbcD/Mre11